MGVLHQGMHITILDSGQGPDQSVPSQTSCSKVYFFGNATTLHERTYLYHWEMASTDALFIKVASFTPDI